MGAIAVYLAKHGKTLLAWGLLLAAIATAVTAISQSSAYAGILLGFRYVSSALGELASFIPSSVTALNQIISSSVGDGDSFGSLLFWLAGLDVCSSMFAFMAAQISLIGTFVVMVGGSALLLFGVVWVLRNLQRYFVALSDGELNGSQMVD